MHPETCLGVKNRLRRTSLAKPKRSSDAGDPSRLINLADSSPDWGALFTPRPGSEVLVDFIDGDIDRPIIVGQVHNGPHELPWPAGVDAGVDGLICVGGGAGGHASAQSSFSLVREIRQFWDGCLVLGGAINDGWQVRAAEALGADLAYVGTRFLATQESNAQTEYKQMVVDSTVADLIYTDRLSGVPAHFLRQSLQKHGVDVSQLPPKRPDMSSLADHSAKLWKDLWSAGHGVATIDDVPTVAALVDRMVQEYRQACALPPSSAISP